MNGVQNKRALTEVFGGWPSFHDAEIVSILLDRGGEDGPVLTAKVHVFETTGDVDEDGLLVTRNHILATLRFGSVQLDYLEQFNHQNVLFSLDIYALDPDQDEGFAFEVTANASYGCTLGLRCHTIEVAAVEPFGP